MYNANSRVTLQLKNKQKGGSCDLNHYSKNRNSEKGGGAKSKRNLYITENQYEKLYNHHKNMHFMQYLC